MVVDFVRDDVCNLRRVEVPESLEAIPDVHLHPLVPRPGYELDPVDVWIPGDADHDGEVVLLGAVVVQDPVLAQGFGVAPVLGVGEHHVDVDLTHRAKVGVDLVEARLEILEGRAVDTGPRVHHAVDPVVVERARIFRQATRELCSEAVRAQDGVRVGADVVRVGMLDRSRLSDTNLEPALRRLCARCVAGVAVDGLSVGRGRCPLLVARVFTDRARTVLGPAITISATGVGLRPTVAATAPAVVLADDAAVPDLGAGGLVGETGPDAECAHEEALPDEDRKLLRGDTALALPPEDEDGGQRDDGDAEHPDHGFSPLFFVKNGETF